MDYAALQAIMHAKYTITSVYLNFRGKMSNKSLETLAVKK